MVLLLATLIGVGEIDIRTLKSAHPVKLIYRVDIASLNKKLVYFVLKKVILSNECINYF